MKTINFKILKINRIWIEATIGETCKCKIKVSDDTKDLKAGETYALLVEDVSIRSKYGTDLRYEVKSSAGDGEPVFIKTIYNSWLVEECKKLGGRWDSEEKVWVFNSFVKDKVEDLEAIYNSDSINIEIKTLESIYRDKGPLEFLGYPLCYATGRDSGAKLYDGVSLLQGRIYSAGSVKNWGTKCSQGSIFRLTISRGVLETFKTDEFDVRILENENRETISSTESAIELSGQLWEECPKCGNEPIYMSAENIEGARSRYEL